MKYSFQTIYCIALLFCFSSFYPKDKAVPDFDFREMGFSKPTVFIYHVAHTTPYATWYDTLGLFCSDNIFSTKMGLTVTEWKFLAGDGSGSYSLDLTKQPIKSFREGTEAKRDKLFMHPARACYSELQCCPYPYFENKPEWTWDFEVGEHWGAGPLFPIKGTEIFHIKYAWQEGRTTFNTPMGDLSCAQVDAVSESTIGVSRATYHLHEKFGLVYFTVSALGKEQFEFVLVEKLESKEQVGKIYPDFVYGKPMPDIDRLLEEGK